MKTALVLVAAGLCMSATGPVAQGYNTETSVARPPDRFKGDGAALVIFTRNVEAICGAAPPGYTKVACAWRKDGVPHIVMPHPSLFADRGDPYAQIMEHELGHTRGWSRYHED